MIRSLFRIAPLVLCFVAASPYLSQGQFSIAAGSTNYTQDFNTLTSGTWTNGTTLSGWYAKTDATASISAYAANTGATTTAGLCAFGVAGTNPLTDRALGYSTSNGFTGTAGTGKNYMGWRLKNNTGNTITSITVTWTGEEWRKDNSPAQTLALSYQTGATVSDPTAGTWTTTSSTFTSPQVNAATAAALDGNATANRAASISVTITVSIAPGDEIMLRWEDLNDSGNDHMLAIDDVTINATASSSCTPPTVQASFQSVTGLLSNSMTVNFAAGTGGIGRMVVVKQGSAVSGAPVSGTAYTTGLSNDFSTSTATITTGEKVVYKGSGSSVNVTGLSPNTAYFVKVYEYNTSDCYITSGTGNTGSATTTCDMPSGQATFGTITPAAFNTTVSFAAGNGSGRLVKINTANSFTDPADGNTYTANSAYSGSGEQVVFNNTSGTSVNVTGLNASTTYYYAIYEYNCSGAAIIYNNVENTASAATTAAAPEINLKQGATGIATGGNYTYTATTAGATTDVVFTIENTGTATLNISSANVSGTGFTLQAAPPVSVSAGNTGSFTVRFAPSGNGAFSGTVTVSNDDGDESAYVINLSGTGTANSLSDITDNGNAGFYTANIDYTQWQSASITSIGTGAGAGAGVFGMLLRDGGAAASDADALPTTLTGLTIGYSGTANTIRSAALFDGTTKIADGVVSANSISFSGLSGAAAADDATKALTLAVTFNTTVTDNNKLAFTVSSATAAGNTVSSQFAAANAGAAASENNTGNDNNRIEVTAAKLRFVQQPVNALVSAAMSSAVTVEATDANNNRDLDYTTAVSVTSTGTLTGSPVNATAASGLATFSGLTHTAAGTGLILTAASGSLTNAISNTFNITSFSGKLWDGGAGTGNWTDANNWEPNGVPVATDDVWLNNDLVSGSYTVTISGNNNAAGRLKVGYTGNTNTITALITGGSSSNDALILGNLTGDDLIVDDGGVVNNSAAASGGGNRGIEFTSSSCSWSMTGTGKFIHNQNGGNFINAGSGNVPEPSLGDNTTVEIQKATTWASGTGLGRIKHYGNLILNFNTAFITAETYLASGDTLLVKGSMEMKGSGASIRVLNNNNAAIVVDIRGNLTVGDGCALTGSEGTGTGAKIIVGGNVTTSGSGFIAGSSGTGNPTTGTNEVILKGDFNGLYGSNSDQEKLTFDGNTTESTVQFSSASDFLTIDINKPIKLLANIPLSRTINVNNGGVLNFNGFNAAGSGAFNVLSGGTLKITSPDGITLATGSAVGNITTTSGARSFSTGGIYQYTGSGAQAQGTGLPATVAGFVVNNAAGVTLSQPVAVSGAFTLTNGILTTTSVNTLTVNAGASLNGGSSSSFVNGPLIVKTNSNAAIALPVGKGTAYGPAAVKPVGAGASTYTAEYFNGANATPDYTNFGSSPLVKVDTFQYWNISHAAGSEDASVTVSWGAASNVTFGGDLVVAHYNGTSWESVGRSAATGSLSAGTITSAPVSSFSPFTLGFTSITPLAVKLSSFDAVKKQNNVVLNWTTEEELAGDHFELERSENGKDYAVLTSVKVNGHASAYSYTDAKPLQGNNYYRLAMIESNGKKRYSNVRIVNMGNTKDFAVTAFPNPVADKLTIQTLNKSAVAVVQLMDMTGKVLQQISMTGDVVDMDMSRFAAGIYLVRYADGTNTELFKIVK